ncbi:MAG: molybdopterin-dependent oxidoreductase [Phycisphaerales bacterium]
MPSITINGKRCDFTPGQMILQVANAHGIAVPQYCYHDGLSIVASCRICLAEVWAPNPRAGGKLEPYMGGKLLPTCQTAAADGMVVYADSPKAVQNQKAVMEYLLINHPLDCPVCDQAGECFLQDYSYEYGRGVSRFEEDKVKNPKKDLGPTIVLYSDRCIMCSRCVRFTREVTGTSELMILGRGNKNEIDVFPGKPLDNPLSGNVADLCPVGALLDKDFLFAQRVWFLKETPSIDGITASGDNIWVHHNEGKVYRVKPRTNPAVNKWWITDEVRYGWKFVHSEDRLRSPMRRQFNTLVECDFNRAYGAIADGFKAAKRLAALVSPMLSCEEAFLLATLARAIDPKATLAVGPIPVRGQDQVFPPGAKPTDANAFVVAAEKCPNARGVRRVLESFGTKALAFDEFVRELGKGAFGGVILTGNYPSEWATDELMAALEKPRGTGHKAQGTGLFVTLIDTLSSRLTDAADVVLPGATWVEKSGTFQNARGMLQAFEQAIPVIEMAKTEGQIALDLISVVAGSPAPAPAPQRILTPAAPGRLPDGMEVTAPRGELFDAPAIRRRMAAASPALAAFTTDVTLPPAEAPREADMAMVEL